MSRPVEPEYRSIQERVADWEAEARQVEAEMAYTSWSQSCQSYGVVVVSTEPDEQGRTGMRGEGRQCRRQRDHSGDHASGFGRSFRQWP